VAPIDVDLGDAPRWYYCYHGLDWKMNLCAVSIGLQSKLPDGGCVVWAGSLLYFCFFGRLPAIRPGAENRGRGVYTGKGRGLGHVTTASSSCSGTHSIEGTERGRRSSSSASEAGVILYLRGGERGGGGGLI